MVCAKKRLEAVYLGLCECGAGAVRKDSWADGFYRFRIAGEERLLKIAPGPRNKQGGFDFPIQNQLKMNRSFAITVENETVTAVRERETGEPVEFCPVVRGRAGVWTLGNLLKTAMEPVGTTLYIYGGGWNWQDTGASVQARALGVSPEWVRFFREQDESYRYRPKDGEGSRQNPAVSYYPSGGYNAYSYAGLDCSGYIGWVLYNTLETENGRPGYVWAADGYAKRLAERGYGVFTRQSHPDDPVKPGDILSVRGHVWLSLGTCGDGSLVLTHATPAGSRFGQPGGGVELSAVGLSKDCEAFRLADAWMAEYYPQWYERYPVMLADPAIYLAFPEAGHGRFTWHTDREILSDPEGVGAMTAEQVLTYLYSGD